MDKVSFITIFLQAIPINNLGSPSSTFTDDRLIPIFREEGQHSRGHIRVFTISAEASAIIGLYQYAIDLGTDLSRYSHPLAAKQS